MHYVKYFFKFLLLFMFNLLLFTILYIASQNSLIFFLRGTSNSVIAYKLFLYYFIYYHPYFIIFSGGVTIIIYFILIDLKEFKSKVYLLRFILPPLILFGCIYYYENFLFKSLDYKIKIDNLKEKIVDDIDYRKIFKKGYNSFLYLNNKTYFYITKLNRKNSSGFYFYKGDFYFLKNFKLRYKSKKDLISITTPFIKNYTTFNKKDFEVKLNVDTLFLKVIFPFDDFSYYFLLIFILIPFVSFFNSSKWKLEGIILLTIFLPFFIIIIHYYDYLARFLLIKVKFLDRFPYKYSIALSITYIVSGFFLYKIIAKKHDLIPRLEIEKIKRISH